MIEQLDGIFETVNYKDATTLKLYYNNENENYPSHWHMSCEIIMPTDNIYTIETPEKTVTLRKGDICNYLSRMYTRSLRSRSWGTNNFPTRHFSIKIYA